MKFIVSWSLPTGTYRAAVSNFLKGGGTPPASVTPIARWHGMSGKGFAVVETTDAMALFAWVSEWSEFINIETTPALDDAEAGAVLATLYS